MKDYTAVGKRVTRIDAAEKVTGTAVFVDDLALPGMLHGKILRSPHPHADIVSIYTSEASSMSDVKAIVTGEDLPEIEDNTRPVIAHGRVRFAGEAVAAVAATDPIAAEEALKLIKVVYKELPPVLDPVQAMKPDAFAVHGEGSRSGEHDDAHHDAKAFNHPNVHHHTHIERGDVERGFAEADFVYEHSFETKIVHQSYLEPHGALARVDSSGKVSIWTSTQAQFVLRAYVAQKLKLPMTQIRIIPTEIGGGFGGKNVSTVEPICALLAQKTGRPVKIVMSRAEELKATNPADASLINLKTGVSKDGIITARQAKIIMDSGAYTTSHVDSTAIRVLGPYKISNVKVDGYAVYTNKTNPGAYRAPGAPQAAFASESQLDIIARDLGVDSLDLRMRNLLESGDTSPDGQIMPAIAFKETLQALADSVGWKSRRKTKNRGMGLACEDLTAASGASSAQVTVNEDGTIKIVSGSINLTGSSTSLAQIAAEELGVATENVAVVTGNTDLVPYVTGNWGSRTVYAMGTVVRKAISDLKNRLFELAAPELDAQAEELETREGCVMMKGDKSRSLPLSVLAALSLTQGGGPVSGTGSLASMARAPVLAAHCTEVEVDTETGHVRVHKLTAAQEVGFAINPQSVEGQIQGGATQGLGWALMEQVVYRDGHVANPGFLDYKIPTAWDTPPIEVVLVQAPSEEGPYGAKGVGEPNIMPTAPAIANAIADAVQARICELPMTPEKVLRALHTVQP